MRHDVESVELKALTLLDSIWVGQDFFYTWVHMRRPLLECNLNVKKKGEIYYYIYHDDII